MSEKIESITVKYNSSKILGWRPIEGDWSKVEKLYNQVQTEFVTRGFEPDDFAGLYFAAVSNTGPLGVMIDHQPDVEPPDEATELVNDINVEIYNNE